MAITKRREDDEFVQCLQCSHANFMQWFTNPIIAYCHTLKQKQVAESRRICKHFVPSGNPEPDIVHYDHYEKKESRGI